MQQEFICLKYFVSSQKYIFKEDTTLEVDVGVKDGLIKPNSTICLPVTIKTSVLGVQEYGVR